MYYIGNEGFPTLDDAKNRIKNNMQFYILFLILVDFVEQ
jgi:hypothetical protein